MKYDNIVIHFYPYSPWIVKCGVNMRIGKKIVFRTCLSDLHAAACFLQRFPDIPAKLITHAGDIDRSAKYSMERL